MTAPTHIVEPERKTPVSGSYDVVVAGGGMAGVAAAVAAARNGASVCIIERYCGLGGLATLGNVTIWLPICDGRGNQVIAGLGEELLTLSVADLEHDNQSARFRRPPACWLPDGDPAERARHRYRADFNPASYLLALEKLVIDEGIALMYDTRVCAINRESSGISHVVVENKSGRSAIACRTVVDATGDADICALAGEETVSLESNVPAGWFYTLDDGALTLHQLSNRYDPCAGTDNADGPFFRGDTAEQVTAHVLETRARLRQWVSDQRAKNPESDPQVVMPAAIACFRMTRRLEGLFTLGEKHMHTWFDDTVGLSGDWRKAGPVYAIPYRCLTAVKTKNLIVAGRCFSVDHTAWDALRAIPTCAVTGEAAGTAAAIAADHTSGDLHALPVRELQQRLREQGVLLDPSLVA